MKKSLFNLISSVLILFVICMLTENGWAASLLPTTNFSGMFETTKGTDGKLALNAFITKANYTDETSTNGNMAGVESIIGKTVRLSGAARTGDYTFSNATLSIIDNDFTYFSATLSNIEFKTDGMFYYLNPSLNGEDPSTLNLSSISMNTDTLHPSRYIEELEVALEGFSVNGMKMTLFIPFNFNGDFKADGKGFITEGLIDGIQNPAHAPVPEPSTILLLGSGLVGLIRYRKLFRKK